MLGLGMQGGGGGRKGHKANRWWRGKTAGAVRVRGKRSGAGKWEVSRRFGKEGEGGVTWRWEGVTPVGGDRG